MPVPTTAQRHKLNRDPILDPHVILLEFQEEGRSAISRAVVNTESVVSNGFTYNRVSMSVTLPATGGDDTSASLAFSNINRKIGRIIDAARKRIGVRLMLVDLSDPDTLIVDTKNLIVLSSISGNSVQISAQLSPRVSLQEPIPFQKTTRNFFPGVWLA